MYVCIIIIILPCILFRNITLPSVLIRFNNNFIILSPRTSSAVSDSFDTRRENTDTSCREF